MPYRYHQSVNIYNNLLTERLSSQDTQFEVIRGKISAIISDTDLQKFMDGTSTWFSEYGNLFMTVEGLNTSFSKLQTTVSNNGQEITEIKSQYASYNQTIDKFNNTITQTNKDLNSLTTKTTEISGTLDDLDLSVSSLKEFTNYDSITGEGTTNITEWLEGKISASASEIKASVSKIYIEGVATYYAVGDSATEAPTEGWSTNTPVWTVGKYIWAKTTVTKNGISSSTVTCIQGAKGEKGDSGIGINNVTEYYAVSSSNTIAPNKDWKTKASEAILTNENKYLWNYEVITKSDNSTISTEKRVIGVYGETGNTGVGISSVVNYYAINNSTTAPSDDKFGTSVQTPTSTNRYLWNYEVIQYTNGTSSKTAKHVIGVYGDTGATGPKGDNGQTTYFHVKYSSLAKPSKASDMYETPSTYIGTYVDFDIADSTDPNKYTWSRFKGEDGSQGVPGKQGESGKTYYLHIAYATSSDGKDGFSTTESTNKTYIGQCVNETSSDPTDYTAYSWSLIKGRGVSMLNPQYALSSSDKAYNANTSLTGWLNTPPAYNLDKYKDDYKKKTGLDLTEMHYWQRMAIRWDDGNTTYSSPYLNEDLRETHQYLYDSEFTVRDDIIKSVVTRADSSGDNVIQSYIKQWYDNITISADHINLDGYIFANGELNLGTIFPHAGTIRGWIVTKEHIRSANDEVYLYTDGSMCFGGESKGKQDVYFKYDDGTYPRLNPSFTYWPLYNYTTTSTSISKASYDPKFRNMFIDRDGYFYNFRAYDNSYFRGQVIFEATKSQTDKLIYNSPTIVDFNTPVRIGYGISKLAREQNEGKNFALNVHTNAFFHYQLYYITNNLTPIRAENAAPLARSQTTGIVGTISSSSKRYKNHVRWMNEKDAEKIYKLKPTWFTYKQGYFEDDVLSKKIYPGFYAEDIETLHSSVVIYKDGKVENWLERNLIPFMVKAIQLNHELIEKLENEIKKLKG